jgi:hypothetical protein
MRRTVSVLVLSGLLALLPAPPALAAGVCPTPYPHPRLSLKVSMPEVVLGDATTVGGNLTRNGCPLPPSPVGLFARTRPGRFTWVAGTTTDRAGHYEFLLRPTTALDLVVIQSASRDYARTVSRQTHISVVKERRQFYPYSIPPCRTVHRDPAPSPLPHGVTFETRAAPATVRAGEHGNVDLVIRNDSRDEVRLASFQPAAWVRNPRNGEFTPPEPCRGYGFGPDLVIPPGEFYVQSLFFATGADRPMWGGDYQLVVAAWFRPDKSAATESAWVTTPLPLHVVGEQV